MLKKIFIFMLVSLGLFAQDAKVLIPKGIYRCVYDAQADGDWKEKKKLDSPAVDVLIFRGVNKPFQLNNILMQNIKTTKNLVHLYNKKNFIVMHIVNKKVKVGEILGVGMENIVNGKKLLGYCVYLGKYWFFNDSREIF